MVTECPHCGATQEPNCEVGDLDICDECEKRYEQFKNVIES